MRNKILTITLLFILFLGMYSYVYADYGIPEIVSYEAIISNEDGVKADAINKGVKDITIPYNETVVVNQEVNGSKSKTPDVFVEYDGEEYEISIKDIKAVEDNDSVLEKAKEEFKLQEPMYVFREGAFLYEGPSVAYDMIKDDNDNPIEIPVGTVVKFEASTEAWGYTEYNGVKGWAYILTSPKQSVYRDLDCAFADIAKEDYSYLYTMKKIKLSKELGSEKVDATIPAGETIQFDLSVAYPDPHYKTVHIKTEDVDGWYTIVDTEVMNDFSKLDFNIFTTSPVTMYKNVNLDNGKGSTKITQLPPCTEIKLLASYQSDYSDVVCVYLEYEGKTGYCISKGNPSLYDYLMLPSNIFYFSDVMYLEEDAEILGYPGYEPTGEFFKKGEKLTPIYDDFTYRYVTNGEKKGFIKISDAEYTTEQKELVKEDYVENIMSKATYEDPVVETQEEPTEVQKASKNNLAICSIIAFVALVVIIFILRSKDHKAKNRNDDNQG